MGALPLDRYDNLLVGALAGQRAAGEVRGRGLDAVVDGWMDGKWSCHVNLLSMNSFAEPSAPSNTAAPS
jgi:hypothetical protein